MASPRMDTSLREETLALTWLATDININVVGDVHIRAAEIIVLDVSMKGCLFINLDLVWIVWVGDIWINPRRFCRANERSK
jgi:hypothetical protein